MSTPGLFRVSERIKSKESHLSESIKKNVWTVLYCELPFTADSETGAVLFDQLIQFIIFVNEVLGESSKLVIHICVTNLILSIPISKQILFLIRIQRKSAQLAL